jgi:hypothetical protein
LFHIHTLILVGKYSNRTIMWTKLLWGVIWFWLRNPTISIQGTWRICFEKNCYKTIVSRSPQLVSNSYQSQIWHLASFKPSICYLLLCWVWSSLVDPCWEIYHAPKIKITHTPHTHAAPILGVCKNMLPLRSTKNFAPTLGVDKKILLGK